MISFERLSLNNLLNMEIQPKGFNTHINTIIYIKDNCFIRNLSKVLADQLL